MSQRDSDDSSADVSTGAFGIGDGLLEAMPDDDLFMSALADVFETQEKLATIGAMGGFPELRMMASMPTETLLGIQTSRLSALEQGFGDSFAAMDVPHGVVEQPPKKTVHVTIEAKDE